MNPRELPCNSPRRTPGGPKKFVVRACSGGESKTIRYGDPKMTIKKSNPDGRRSYRVTQGCDTRPRSKLPPRVGSCRNW